MFISTLIEEMYFVGSGDGDGGVDGYIRNCDSDDSFVIAFKIFYLSFWKEAHVINKWYWSLNLNKNYNKNIIFMIVIWNRKKMCCIHVDLLMTRTWYLWLYIQGTESFLSSHDCFCSWYTKFVLSFVRNDSFSH